MKSNKLKENEMVEWNIKNASKLITEKDYLSNDHFDEPTLFITNKIRFSDNKWDFSDEIRKNIIFNFTNINSKEFRVYSKKVVLRSLFNSGNRNITASILFSNLNRFIQFLEKEKYMYDLKYITPEIIEEYIEGYRKKNLTKQYIHKQLESIGKLLKEIELARFDSNFDLSQYKNILQSTSWEDINAEVEINKTRIIPSRIFKDIVQTALVDMEDDGLSTEDRMMACLIVILSYTGMRKGELGILEANKLKDITIMNKEEKAYILEFFTYKTTGKKNGRWTVSIAFPNTIKAYKTLENISEERRRRGDSNYLFLNRKGQRYSNAAFSNMFDMFFCRHQNLFDGMSDLELSQVHYSKVSVYLRGYLQRRRNLKYCIDDYFFALNAHQFRVTFANKLKDKVSLQWIREHMNHLDEEMTKHYFRDDKIKEILYKHASPEGTSLDFNADNNIKTKLPQEELVKAYKEINKFLKKKHFNIFKNIDEIIDTLKFNPLRESIVGVCTKQLGILCELQDRLATFEKWYYLSPSLPNIESFDFTYKRFIDKSKIVQHNKRLMGEDLKYQRDYENEFNALKKFYKNRFIPEYEVVISRLNDEGMEAFLDSFPHLKGIVCNIDEIEKEISKWTLELTLISM